MKYYRLNQIAMAVLGALLLFFGARTIVNIAFEKPEPEKPGFEVATTKPDKKPEKPAGGAAAGGSQIAVLLASADPKQGESDAALCKACHSFDKGGPTIVGPNLYGALGRKIASVAGFNYTPGLKAHDGTWTYELVDTWITNPQAFAPGTMMAFPGIPDAKKRANVIAFLRSKNDNPPPLPAAGTPATPAAPAGEATPAKPAAPEQTAPAEAAIPAAPEAVKPEAAPPSEPPAAAPSESPAAPTETPAPEPAQPEAAAPSESSAPSAETPASGAAPAEPAEEPKQDSGSGDGQPPQ
jgi:cytochrome c